MNRKKAISRPDRRLLDSASRPEKTAFIIRSIVLFSFLFFCNPARDAGGKSFKAVFVAGHTVLCEESKIAVC